MALTQTQASLANASEHAQTSHNYRAGEGELLSASASLDTMTMIETDVVSDSPLRRARDTLQQSMLGIQGEIIGRLSVRQILHYALCYDTDKKNVPEKQLLPN